MTRGTQITVLIPAYQAANTLPRALASVAAQTLRPAGILIVDDGSAPALTAPAMAGDVPVRILRLARNGGSSAALNHGLAAIETPWIALLDADDEWLPGKLARQAPLMEQADLIATGLRFVAGDGGAIMDVATSPLTSGDVLPSLLEDCIIGKPTVLVRAALLRAMGGFDTLLPIGEDQAMWLRIAAEARIALVPEVLVLAHDTPGSLTKRTDLPPDLLWTRVIEPLVQRHKARLGPQWVRRITGARCQQAAWRCLAVGRYGLGWRYLLRASLAGHQPLANFRYALTSAPPVVAFKRWLRGAG
jgi:glycosyltransferase involved in cell wall biosynthesis